MASVSEEVRLLMSRHLQSNVWSDCAYSLENVKSYRWHLGSSGRAEGVWKDIMTVTKAKQVCFIQRIHFAFQVRRRQVKAAMHSRMNQEQWDATLEGVCFMVWVLDCMRAATTDDGAAPLFSADVLRSGFQKVLEGDYTSEAEKHCLLRLADVKPQDCSIWADHMPKDPAANALKDCREQITKLDQESIQKTFESDCYKLTWDLSAFASHVDSLSKNKRTAQIAKVCHVRAEMKRGSNAVVNFMEKNCLHETALFKDRDTCENVKKWLNASRPDAAIVWADLTKFGRLQTEVLNEVSELLRGVLSHSPQIMVGIVVVPVLSSSRVGNGIRGELRRLEDKLDAKFLDNVHVNIRMGEPHNNKKHALLYPALVCWPAGTSDNIFESSKLVIDRCNREPVEWMLERDYKVPTIGKNATPSTREDLDRSHSEAQEAAQHLGGLHMPQVVMQSLLKDTALDSSSRICCINFTPYDGAFEKACIQSAHNNGILSYSIAEDNMIVKYCERMVAQYLLEDWKTGNNIVGASNFQPEPAAEAASQGPSDPTFNLCSLATTPEGNLAIALPPGIRSKWSEDSARKDDWEKLLKKFSHVNAVIKHLLRVHTTATASGTSSTSVTTASGVSTAATDDGMWASEPKTSDELESRYDILHSFPGRNANVTLKITSSTEKNQEQAANVCEGQVHKLFLVLNSDFKLNDQHVANSDVTLPKTEYQLAHDRASFLSGQKVQKLMEQGGRRRFEASSLFSFTMDDRSSDLMAFLMSSHSSMPAAAMNPEAGASSASPSTGRLARTVTPPPVQRQLSFESETTQILGGPYRRGATMDSDMGLTPKTATKVRAASTLLPESPLPSALHTSDDPALMKEIDAVTEKLQTELKMDEKKNKEKTTKKAETSETQPKQKAETSKKQPQKAETSDTQPKQNAEISKKQPKKNPAEEPQPGSLGAMVKSAVHTSATASGAGKNVIFPPGWRKGADSKAKASAKKKPEKKKKETDSGEDQDSQNGSAASADEGQGSDVMEDQDSKNGSAASADEGQGSDMEAEDSDEGHAKKKASPKKAACKKSAIKPKAAAKSSGNKKNKDGKKGANKIPAEAGSHPTKRPIEKEKKPRKETALTEGWKKFSTDYIREHKGEGKKLSQLMKEASEQCPLKDATNIVCSWASDSDPVVFETAEGRRLKDAEISTMKLLIEEMESNGIVDLTINSHDMDRCDEGGDDDHVFTIEPSSDAPPLVFKFTKNSGQNLKFTNAASFFDNRSLMSSEALRMVWRVSFNADEQEISPKKPLYFLKQPAELQKQQVMRLL
ncbi:unnamed protein product [Symbiodinium sp. CCMP2592]|nr:unnamed protein product [Symbiodinium sp. CCMP2592]